MVWVFPPWLSWQLSVFLLWVLETNWNPTYWKANPKLPIIKLLQFRFWCKFYPSYCQNFESHEVLMRNTSCFQFMNAVNQKKVNIVKEDAGILAIFSCVSFSLWHRGAYHVSGVPWILAEVLVGNGMCQVGTVTAEQGLDKCPEFRPEEGWNMSVKVKLILHLSLASTASLCLIR